MTATWGSRALGALEEPFVACEPNTAVNVCLVFIRIHMNEHDGMNCVVFSVFVEQAQCFAVGIASACALSLAARSEDSLVCVLLFAWGK